jgi:quercetin dioxygenase-like cupin family protein
VRIFPFDAAAGIPIDRYGSRFTMARLAHPAGLHVGCMHLPPGGLVGRHPAAIPQLFVVTAGAGWVEGGDGPPIPIAAGQAVFWQAGEEHAAGSDTGMTAIVVESELLATDLSALGPVIRRSP